MTANHFLAVFTQLKWSECCNSEPIDIHTKTKLRMYAAYGLSNFWWRHNATKRNKKSLVHTPIRVYPAFVLYRTRVRVCRSSFTRRVSALRPLPDAWLPFVLYQTHSCPSCFTGRVSVARPLPDPWLPFVLYQTRVCRVCFTRRLVTIRSDALVVAHDYR